MDNEKVFAMPFSRVYPLLVAKAERKGRTREEVDTLICWLTGCDAAGIQDQLEKNVSCGDFFRQAPAMNPLAEKITGKICGITVETIPDPLMKRIRQLDKLVDELARGKPMEKILRR